MPYILDEPPVPEKDLTKIAQSLRTSDNRDPFQSLDTKFHSTFSGADYTITAVIPWEDDYVRSAQKNLANIRESISLIEADLKKATKESDKQHLRTLLESFRIDTAAATNIPFLKTFAEIQTLSISSRRSVNPVRRLGEVTAAFYCRGAATFAGSMVFAQLDGDVLLNLLRRTDKDLTMSRQNLLLHQIPPFHILITGMNEYGHFVEGAILGVTLVATGKTLSVDDMYTEEQVTYVALGYSPMARREKKDLLLEEIGRSWVVRGEGVASSLDQGVNQASTKRGQVSPALSSPRPRGDRLSKSPPPMF